MRPLFIVLWVCMWMTAAIEMGPDQWFPRVMGELVPQLSPEAGSGVLFLVYTGGLMFVLRMWGSNVTHKSPVVTMIVELAPERGRLVLARRARQHVQRGRGADGRDALRHRQDIPVADDDRHHRGTVSARRCAAALADGRHRPSFGCHRPAHHGRTDGSVRARCGAADGSRARGHPDRHLHRALVLLPLAGWLSRRCDYRRRDRPSATRSRRRSSQRDDQPVPGSAVLRFWGAGSRFWVPGCSPSSRRLHPPVRERRRTS